MGVKASHEGRAQALNFKEVDRPRETERERVGCLPGTWGGREAPAEKQRTQTVKQATVVARQGLY